MKNRKISINIGGFDKEKVDLGFYQENGGCYRGKWNEIEILP